MSKDDYHVIAYKILSYLYDCIKGKKTFSIDYFQFGTKTFPVDLNDPPKMVHRST